MKKNLKVLVANLIVICGISMFFGDIAVKASEKSNQYISDEKELINDIREAMINRKTKITLHYVDDKILEKGILDKWLAKVFVETGEPDEGDYLKAHYKSAKMKYSGAIRGGIYYFDITLEFAYHSTNAQEQEVTQKVNSIVDKLHLHDESISDYQKIVLVHEHLRSLISYDYNQSSSSYSAYAACVKGKSVCQGYACTFYRLMREAGIDCRIITGKSQNSAHAWNIVKLDGKYYNVDVTWADTAKTMKYFLKGSSSFSDHKSDSQYLTSTFKSKYPISKSNYSSSEHVWGTTLKTYKAASFTTDGYKVKRCLICDKVKPNSKVVINKVPSVKLSQSIYTYNGKIRRPSVTLLDAKNKKLKEGTDYTLTYSNGRKNVGRYYVTVKLKGSYTGTKKLYFTIRPKAPASLSAKVDRKNKSVKLTWKKSTGASGYSIYYCENPGKNPTYKRWIRTTKLYYIKTKLKSNTTYKFKIVPYYKTTVSGKTVFYESKEASYISVK